MRARRGFRGEGPLEAWLWRAVVNAARNQRRRPVAAGVAPAQNGAAPDDAPDLPFHLLTDRQRHVLFLRYYADLEYDAIAAALGIAPGTVAATLNAAHAKLRRALEEVTP